MMTKSVIISCNSPHRILSVEQAGENFLGYESVSLLGQSISIFEGVRTNIKGLKQAIQNAFLKTMKMKVLLFDMSKMIHLCLITIQHIESGFMGHNACMFILQASRREESLGFLCIHDAVRGCEEQQRKDKNLDRKTKNLTPNDCHGCQALQAINSEKLIQTDISTPSTADKKQNRSQGYDDVLRNGFNSNYNSTFFDAETDSPPRTEGCNSVQHLPLMAISVQDQTRRPLKPCRGKSVKATHARVVRKRLTSPIQNCGGGMSIKLMEISRTAALDDHPNNAKEILFCDSPQVPDSPELESPESRASATCIPNAKDGAIELSVEALFREELMADDEACAMQLLSAIWRRSTSACDGGWP